MIRFLIEKEFKQILRNSFMPRMIVMLPTMMLLIMPWAANQEIKDLKLSVVDNDHSTTSQRLIQKITSSGYFHLTNVSPSNGLAMESIESAEADAILEIEPDFEQNLVKDGTAHVSISVNAVNGVKGGLGSSYLTAIVQDYASELLAERGMPDHGIVVPSLGIAARYWFNPHLDYKVFMVPALMVMLLTMLTAFLPALNIVGEKEVGTIEQINVTPVGKITFILAKLIPYWIIGYIVLTIGIILSALVYGLVSAGSLALVYLYATVYILVMSGMGLVISNYSASMQQAQFVSMFFIIVLIMISGLFFPISSMPETVQTITLLNPLRYFMEVMRAVYLKGSGFAELLPQLFALVGFAIIFNTWAVISYKKSL